LDLLSLLCDYDCLDLYVLLFVDPESTVEANKLEDTFNKNVYQDEDEKEGTW
jgi:hypothetical protein